MRPHHQAFSLAISDCKYDILLQHTSLSEKYCISNTLNREHCELNEFWLYCVFMCYK